MAETTTILCDNCGKDITATPNEVDYLLTLSAQNMPQAAGSNSTTINQPPVPRTLYLCTMACVAAKVAALIAAQAPPSPPA